MFWELHVHQTAPFSGWTVLCLTFTMLFSNWLKPEFAWYMTILQRNADFLSYFEATAELLDADPTLWCVSSWNDNGFSTWHEWDTARLVRSCSSYLKNMFRLLSLLLVIVSSTFQMLLLLSVHLIEVVWMERAAGKLGQNATGYLLIVTARCSSGHPIFLDWAGWWSVNSG